MTIYKLTQLATSQPTSANHWLGFARRLPLLQMSTLRHILRGLILVLLDKAPPRPLLPQPPPSQLQQALQPHTPVLQLLTCPHNPQPASNKQRLQKLLRPDQILAYLSELALITQPAKQALLHS